MITCTCGTVRPAPVTSPCPHCTPMATKPNRAERDVETAPSWTWALR